MVVLAFLCCLILTFGLAMMLLRPRKSETVVHARMTEVLASHAAVNEATSSSLERVARRSGTLSRRLGNFVERFGFSDRLKLLIMHAGSTASVGSIIGGSIVGAVAGGFIAYIAIGVLPLEIAAVVAGGCSRWALLKWQMSRRLKKFTTALPDAIELIARALRAGHSMSSAIEIVAEQTPEPLCSEFAIVFRQQKFGIPFRDALLELGERIPSKDLHFLITAILVQKETGGDLTEILDRTTHVIRERVRIEGEIKTYTAQGRLTGWILGALPIIMLALINIVTPGYSHILFYDPLGQKLLYAGGIFIVIGGLVIRKIVDIKV